MKRHMLKRVGTLLICAVLITGGALAAGSIVTKTIDVQYMNIKLVVDGVEVTPKDANGTVVEPFVHNGTTYLPVRAVGAAIGKEVDWDGNTRTVYIGDIPGKVNNDYLEPYQTDKYSYTYSNDPTKHFTMMGAKYTQGFVTSSNWGDATALFNLDGRYSSIEFDLGHIDKGSNSIGILHIFVDGKLVQDIDLAGDMQTKHISVPVNYGLQLKLVREDTSTNLWPGEYGVANLIGIK